MVRACSSCVQRENLFERVSPTVTAAKETVLGVLLPYFTVLLNRILNQI
jgi:hypothetical protein